MISRSRLRHAILFFAIFLLAAVRVTQLAWRMSPTYDEPKHLATGITYLAQGWCCFGKDNTPMVALNAIPLYAMGALPRLEGGDAKLAVSAPADENPIRVRYFRARLMNLPLLLALLLGVALAVGRRLGPGAGLLAALLVSLEPNLIANAALVSPDFHVAATLTLAALATGALLLERGPSPLRLVACGLAIAAALLSKYNALALVPAFPLVAALLPAATWRARAARVASVLGAIAIAGVVVMLAYELPHRAGGLHRLARWPFPDTAWANALERSTDPPANDEIGYGFLGGVAEVRRIMKMGYPSYFCGRIANTFPLFYPALVWWKTPVPLLLLVPLGIWFALRPARDPGLLLLLATSAWLFAGAMTSGLALGLRHILPLYPMFGMLAALAIVRARGRLALKAGLVLAFAVACVRWHGDELAYFNELAGGPERGHRYFADSNLDWGQDLFRLREALERFRVPCEGYLHAPLSPAHLGLLLKVQGPRLHGWVAVSVTRKLGMWDNMYRSDQALQQAIATQSPAGRIGYSIWLYHLP